MFGWEFPPYFAGGVGMVCYELTKQLSSLGVEIKYVMPYAPETLQSDFLQLVDVSRNVDTTQNLETYQHLSVTKVQGLLTAYQTQDEYFLQKSLLEQRSSTLSRPALRDNTRKLYGDNLLEEMDLFSQRVAYLYDQGHFRDFQVIHAHDWTTVPAATVVKRKSGKPLLIHVHITEFDKNGGAGANPQIYEIERQGFFAADEILTVSQKIKDTLVSHYGIDPQKIEVVHNGNVKMNPVVHAGEEFKQGHKVVSYLGRVTTQKGPEHFVEMAALVLQHYPKTKFVMGGTGDKLQSCIDRAKQLGIYDNFYFHGFYTREDADFFYDVSDVFVLPSLSEPFGVTPLEAMCKDTPTIVTKQSGVSEVLKHVFKVDWWDVQKMASQVLHLLVNPTLHGLLKKKGKQEAESLDWQKPAKKCMALYQEVSS